MVDRNIPDWIRDLFAAIDSMDPGSFCDFLTDDAVFTYGSGEPIRGKAAIYAGVTQFYQSFKTLHHDIHAAWEVGEVTFVQIDVTYTLPSRKEVTIPALDLFHMEGSKIRDYLIYIDPTPVFAGSSDTQ